METQKELTLEECKEIELGILKYIRDICNANQLKYYLTYGTLLGAIRHKGFIPWDDDIDIFMPYEDYIKFIDVMSKETGNDYKLVSYEVNDGYTAPLGKVIDNRTILEQSYGFIERIPLGVYVDIFVLSGAGQNEEEANKNVSHLFRLLRGWRFADSIVKKDELPIRKIIKIIRNAPYKFIGLKHYLNKIRDYREEHPFYESKYVTQSSLTSVNNIQRNIWLQEDYGIGVDVPFENELFRAPVSYDKLLTQYYGEYMKLPPAEKQVTQHNYKAFWA